MEPKSLKKNAALNMIKTVMSLIFPLITFPYSSRVLGPVFIGRVNFAQSVTSYFALIAALGINTYAVREASRIREDKKALSVFIKEIFSLNMLSTLAAYILFAIAIFVVPQFAEYRRLLIICASSILFSTLGMDYLYTALEEFKYITIRSIVFQFVSLFLLFTMVKTQDDYYKYAAISVISSVGSNLLNFFHARRFISFKTGVPVCIKKHLKSVFTFFAMNAAVSIYTVLDTTMLGFICNDEAVGLYTAATKLNRMVIMLITAATAVLLPRLSLYAYKETKDDFLSLSKKAFDFIILFSFPCAAGLFVLSRPVILLFSGEQFLQAVPAMKIMNAVIVFISITGLIGTQIFMAVGKEKITLISVITGAVVNFVLNSILIPLKGVYGAAVATVVAEFSVMVIQLIYARKYLDYVKSLSHILKVILSTAIMAVLVWMIASLFDSLILETLVRVVSGVVVYFVSLLILRDDFTLSFIKTALSSVNKKRSGENK